MDRPFVDFGPEPTPDTARRVGTPVPTFADVPRGQAGVEEIARRFELTAEEMLRAGAGSRKAPRPAARAALYRHLQAAGWTLEKIAAFAKRDRASIHSALRGHSW